MIICVIIVTFAVVYIIIIVPACFNGMVLGSPVLGVISKLSRLCLYAQMHDVLNDRSSSGCMRNAAAD
jgi:hypothetical protein